MMILPEILQYVCEWDNSIFFTVSKAQIHKIKEVFVDVSTDTDI